MKVLQKMASGTCEIRFGKVKSELKQTGSEISLFRGSNGVVC